AFQRLEQGGLLPTNISAGAPVHPDVNRHAGALDVLADVARPPGLGDRFFEDPRSQDELASYIDVGALGADRITGEEDSFQHLVRIALDQLPVLKCPGLAFVGITAEVPRSLVVLGQESPFDPRRKSRA